MRKNILFTRLVAAFVFLLPLSVTRAEEDLPVPRNTQLILGVENFTLDDSLFGVKMQEEIGARGVIGLGWSNLFIPSEKFVYRANLSVYGGIADYSFVALGPSLTSTSTYAGLKFEGMGGYRFGSTIGVEVFSGMGIDMWYHGVKESATIASFDEYFAIANAKLGVSVLQRFNSFGYFIRAGIKAPFYTWNHVSALDGVDVHPVPHLSGFAEVNFTFGGIPHDRFVLSAYYDSYRLGRSKGENLYDHGVLVGTYYSNDTDVDTVGVQAIFGF